MRETPQPTRLRRAGRAGGRRRAAGVIVVILLVLLVVGSVVAVVHGLSTAAAAVKLSRDETTGTALQRAKQALIARAALDLNRPGSLPCPDLVTNVAGNVPNDGNADLLAGNDCPSYIGRLPWRTLGLPDLRDSSGERLWYALSPNFRDDDSAAINSDTQGTLTVEGATDARGVVAIVFAPGAVLGAQVRDAAGVNTVANYLEAPNPYVASVFLAATGCDTTACSLPFSGGAAVASPHNDQLILITHEDLFRVVEPVVQRRIEQEILPLLTNPVPNTPPTVSAAATDCPAFPGPGPYAPTHQWGYFELWGRDLFGPCQWLRGFFPFAAPYEDPLSMTPLGSPLTLPDRVQDEYRGRFPQTAGLLPVSTAVTWTAAATAPPLPGSSITAPTCTATTCSFTYTCDASCGSLPVTAPVRLREAAGSLVLPTGITSAGDWSTAVQAPAIPLSPAITFARSFDVTTGDLVFTLQFTLPQVPGSTVVNITPPTPTFSPLTSATNWFIANRWYRQTYYAVSDGFGLRSDLGTRPIDRVAATAAYDASPPCGAAPSCVTVLSGPTTTAARAVLVLAGRHRDGGVRTYTIANYFELKNADVPQLFGPPANLEFERGLRSGNFNDRVVVVAPEPLAP